MNGSRLKVICLSVHASHQALLKTIVFISFASQQFLHVPVTITDAPGDFPVFVPWARNLLKTAQ